MRTRIIDALELDSAAFLVPHYVFFLTLSMIAGALLALRHCRRQGLSQEASCQAVFYALLFLLPGARLVYALQYPHLFPDVWAVLRPSGGGLALYGGLLAVLVVPSLYLWSRREAVNSYLDALVPSLALGLVLGRLGCFSAGCNWGKVTALPWGVSFPPPSHAYAQHLQAGWILPGAPLSLSVHPTQLYESFFGLLILGLTYRWLSSRWTSGSVFWMGISCYSLFRFAVEFLRADSGGAALGPLSFAQGVSVLMFASSQFFLWRSSWREAVFRRAVAG